jgi:hypothetical protein
MTFHSFLVVGGVGDFSVHMRFVLEGHSHDCILLLSYCIKICIK